MIVNDNFDEIEDNKHLASRRALHVACPMVCLSLSTVGEVNRASANARIIASVTSANCVVRSYVFSSDIKYVADAQPSSWRLIPNQSKNGIRSASDPS